MTPLCIMLLVNHDNTSIPGQWAILVAKDRRHKGTLFRAFERRSRGINREIRNDFVIDRRETVSVITLGAVLDSEVPLLEEIVTEVDMPWPKGACSKKFDCREWVILFVQGLVQESFLRPCVMDKLRMAREIELDGPALRV
ncbi:hypothetical protein BHE90_000021 [Fusarium euwallaceae]|uniref:Uncharacterized protein n=1 Tax=Fusarium euwallaceae TaxID=1147111 RepID=A0A430MBP1_9HYPO|nr:hypothetical protein BHE90_000021 [Fusarium euwallaceae]